MNTIHTLDLSLAEIARRGYMTMTYRDMAPAPARTVLSRHSTARSRLPSVGAAGDYRFQPAVWDGNVYAAGHRGEVARFDLTDKNGNVFYFWPAYTARRIYVRKSTNGGLTVQDTMAQVLAQPGGNTIHLGDIAAIRDELAIDLPLLDTTGLDRPATERVMEQLAGA